jgi:GT2 family glycosyltransferase
MKPASCRAEVTAYSRRINRRGIFHTIHAIRWRIGVALHKRYLRFQDWSGLYSYQDWSQFYEKKKLMEPADSPEICISIIIKATKSNLNQVKDTFEALILQSHRNWEAYLILEQVENKLDFPVDIQDEPRIHLIENPIHPAWKAGLTACKGDWVVYLNSGDALAADALANVAHDIKTNPSATVIYSDTDRLSQNDLIRYSPSFWPDFSPELLLSVNYLQSAFLQRTDLSKAAEKTDDLEDALLRCVEEASKIIHIPHVLCHQRDGQDNTWLEDAFQPDNLVAHLERIGLKGVTSQTSSSSGSMHFSWEFNDPLISIIILTRDKVELLKRCLDSIFKYTSYPNYEIILVENNSREKATFEYYEQLKSIPGVKVLAHHLPFNYSSFNNWGAKNSAGEVLLFINNDIQCFERGWLEEMVLWTCRAEIGVVGAKLLYPSGAIQHAGLVVGLEGHANHIFAGKAESYCGLFGTDEWYRDYSAVTGACMMMRQEVFDQLGGFDEQYSLAFNDIELCLRAIEAGYRVVYTPFARLFHLEGATRSGLKPSGDIQLAYQHLKTLIEQGDPYYNPNLSLSLRVPTLRRPDEMPALKRLEQILEYES